MRGGLRLPAEVGGSKNTFTSGLYGFCVQWLSVTGGSNGGKFQFLSMCAHTHVRDVDEFIFCHGNEC